MIELPNSNRIVRDSVHSCLELLATETGDEVTEVLFILIFFSSFLSFPLFINELKRSLNLIEKKFFI